MVPLDEALPSKVTAIRLPASVTRCKTAGLDRVVVRFCEPSSPVSVGGVVGLRITDSGVGVAVRVGVTVRVGFAVAVQVGV